MNGPKPVGQFKGRVMRWGAGGFGFVSVPALGRDVYFNDRAIVGELPTVGEEVDLDVVEYPGDKLVARSIRSTSPARRAPEPGPLRARIPGIAALAVTPRAEPPRPSAPAPAPRPRPTTLSGIADYARHENAEKVDALRLQVAELEYASASVDERTHALRAEAAKKRRDLEDEIARIERATEQQIEEITKRAGHANDQLVRLRSQIEKLESAAAETVHDAVTGLIASEAARVTEELERRTRALASITTARAVAVRTAGEEVVRKYDDARRKARTWPDADEREAFVLLERQRRETVRGYAEALDATDGWTPLVVPVWQIGADGSSGGASIVLPVASDALDAEGVAWRVASTLCEAVERARSDLSRDGAEPTVEIGAVAGCFAIHIDGLDTELLPLHLEEAQRMRPSIERLRVELRWEEAQQLRLAVVLPEGRATSLDEDDAFVRVPPTGGSTREIAERLGFDVGELLSMLVERGLPFPDDALDAGTEESIRALLGLEAPAPESPAPSPPPAPPGPAPEVELELELQIAARLLAKLLRKHVIGGKHTAIQNVYGHHFSDSDKDVAKDVTERLIRAGILNEKQSVGARHVSINPRRLDQTRALAEQRCDDPYVLKAILTS